ncbi:MAG: hypothetical protein DRJ56_03620 [Thermoprotei archaeon]|nr:MAG: hypothetical protein DRJ56_03620 [Thermoprotei archaeon]
MRLLEALERVRGRIVDVHSHVGSDQRFLLDGSPGRIVQVMDRYGIGVSLVSSTHSLLADFREGNRLALEAVREHPGRLLGLVAVNPHYGEEALEELRRYVGAGFVGVKLHPNYFKISVLDELTLRVLEEAERVGVPAMIHSYDGGVEVSRLAELFPDLTIVMYHMGGARWREGVERVRRFDNVYAEVSSSVADAGMVEAAVEALGYERVLFGTDMPYLDPAVSLGKVLGADISWEAKEAILCYNAEEVIGPRLREL